MATLLVIVLLLSLAVYLAWPGGGTRPRLRRASGTASHRHGPAVPPSLVASLEKWRLPAPVSREAVLPSGSGLMVIGGLDAAGNSLNGVESIDPSSGTVRSGPPLGTPVHDAAAAQLPGGTFVFGGGSPTTVATIEPVGATASPPGALPEPRSDSAAVVLESDTTGHEVPTAFVVGGYTGFTYLPEVLATSDGRTFATVARLPVPVRYPAVAACAGRIYLFGGEVAAPGSSTVLTNDIQMVDPATHQAVVVGHLAEAIYGAAAFCIDSALYVAGGATAGGSSLARMSLFEPASHKVLDAGALPQPEAFGGYTTVGSGSDAVGYIVGGEVGGSSGNGSDQASSTLPTVMSLRPSTGQTHPQPG